MAKVNILTLSRLKVVWPNNFQLHTTCKADRLSRPIRSLESALSAFISDSSKHGDSHVKEKKDY